MVPTTIGKTSLTTGRPDLVINFWMSLCSAFTALLGAKDLVEAVTNDGSHVQRRGLIARIVDWRIG